MLPVGGAGRLGRELGCDGRIAWNHPVSYARCFRQGKDTVKLIGREWKILDSNGKVASSVPRNSPGVIGQHPELR